MPHHLAFWAKLGHHCWPDQYHPLLCHMIDVGCVAQAIWDRVIRDRVKDWVTSSLGLDQDRTTAGKWLSFWIGAHDIGKACRCFQIRGDDPRTQKLLDELPESEWHNPGIVEAHAYVSTTILKAALCEGWGWPGVDKTTANRVAVAVGGHHGLFPPDLSKAELAAGKNNWRKAQRDLLKRLAELLGVNESPSPKPSGALKDQSLWMFLAGLTSVADWVGSNKEFFREEITPGRKPGDIDIEEYFSRSHETAHRALEELGWLGRAEDNTPMTFVDLFGIPTPRPLQTKIEELASGLSGPSLYIVEAPMGEGKTEAAWYVADRWDRMGGQGAYVALPTMATSNQMFDRVDKFLQARAGKSNVQLLHGKAQLNSLYERLKYAADIYDDNQSPSAVVAESWFAANKKQGLLAPFGVGTIDQSLMAVLQTKHVFVRLFGLAGKCVILDEVHAYDAYMTTLLERLLNWLSALGCPVVLLSATLPKDRREKLLRAYAPWEKEMPIAPYPRITVAGGGEAPRAYSIEADKSRARILTLEWLLENQLASRLKTALADGGCACVIRNTVGSAQKTYQELQEVFKHEIDSGEIKLGLFHARFPFGRRQEIEEEVLATFGKGNDGGPNNPNRPKKAILVATQVVEQSLDLDFDLMVTDVAPADLILQRAGRIWRHDRTDRCKAQRNATLWLIEPTMEGNIPNFGVSEWVYDAHVLFRSWIELQRKFDIRRVSVCLPDEIDSMVEAVYHEMEAPGELPENSREHWRETFLEMEKKRESEKSKAEERRIRRPQYGGALASMVQTPRAEDNPDLHPAHQALTRLTGPAAQVICLTVATDGRLSHTHNGHSVRSLKIRPMSFGGMDDLRDLLHAELSLSHFGIVKALWQAPQRPNEWQDVGALGRHHLILFRESTAIVGGYKLILDRQLGLRVVKEGEEGEDL